jgi:hypothetical protein
MGMEMLQCNMNRRAGENNFGQPKMAANSMKSFQVPTTKIRSAPCRVFNFIQTALTGGRTLPAIESLSQGDRAWPPTWTGTHRGVRTIRATTVVRRGVSCTRHSAIQDSHPTWSGTCVPCAGERSCFPWSSRISFTRGGRSTRTHARRAGRSNRGSLRPRPTMQRSRRRRNRAGGSLGRRPWPAPPATSGAMVAATTGPGGGRA